MKYCPNCGKAEVEGMKFCPHCGQSLTGFSSAEKQRYVQQLETPLKERNWFERHLNWTMVLAWLSTYPITFIVSSVLILIDPYISDDAFVALLVTANLAVTVAVGRWVLQKKNRSMWWLLISPFIFFLLIENKSPIQDEHGKTAADYDKAIELAPNDADTYYERGDFYYEMDEYSKAIDDYSKAIRLNPNYTDAYHNRGCAYGEMGEYDNAIVDYNKAIELAPDDADAYHSRGLAYREKGGVARAVSDLEKCISLSTDPELTEDAQQTLHEIKNPPRTRTP